MKLKEFIKKYFFLLFGFDIKDIKSQLLFWRQKEFEEALAIRKFFRANRRKKGTMIDVGAHFGESFRPYLINGWTIYAFEPDPDPRKEHALNALKSPRLHLFDLAITNSSGQEVPFYASDESSGISSLSQFTPGHEFAKTVKTETLRNFIAAQQITQIDFLKIDTEGHDLFVLKGFPWETQTLFPEVILCEFEDGKTKPLGYDYRELGNILIENGYAVYLSEYYPIVRYGVKHRWRCINKYPCKLVDDNGWGNFIAVKKTNDMIMTSVLKSFGIKSI